MKMFAWCRAWEARRRETAAQDMRVKATRHATEQREAQAAIFMDHARWLIEWHDKRADEASTRAVAVLGFSGVALALVVQGANLRDLSPTPWTWTFAIWAGLALISAAGFALGAIAVRPSVAHELTDFRSWWAESSSPPFRPSGADLTESLVGGADLAMKTPLTAANALADSRVRSLKKAVWSLLVAVLGLAALGANVLYLAQGG